MSGKQPVWPAVEAWNVEPVGYHDLEQRPAFKIALHVVNNVIATLFGALGLADPDAEESSWVALALSAGMQMLFAWLVVRGARRRGVEVTRTVHPPRPPLLLAAGRGPGGAGPEPGTWVCPGPPACPGHWAGRAPGRAPQPLS